MTDDAAAAAPRPTATRPLVGVRVLDLSTVLMGPYASQALGDYGADVIKIEPPEGDSTRRTGPATEPGMSAVFLGTNRNKRSIVLDLKRPEGRAALLRLAERADVLMHNIRPQKLAGIGIDPEALRRRNPRLVYAALVGFGEGGRYAGEPAYDDIIQGMSGLADMMASLHGEPRYVPTAAADKITGLVAANAILAALMARERTGQGSAIEIPMFETMVGFNLVEHLYGESFVPPQGATGYPRALAPWRRPYRTADGYICMMPYTDRHWRDFFVEAGAPEFASDPRFIGIGARTLHIEALYELAGRLAATRSTEAWLAACRRLQIPAAPVCRLQELTADPHLAETGFFVEADDPRMGCVRLTGVPVRFDGERPPSALPPRLGEHTEAVLSEAGFSPEEIAALRGAAARASDKAQSVPENAA